MKALKPIVHILRSNQWQTKLQLAGACDAKEPDVSLGRKQKWNKSEFWTNINQESVSVCQQFTTTNLWRVYSFLCCLQETKINWCWMLNTS